VVPIMLRIAQYIVNSPREAARLLGDIVHNRTGSFIHLVQEIPSMSVERKDTSSD